MFDYDDDAKRAVEKLDEYDFNKILRLCYESDIRDSDDIRNHIMDEHYPELKETLADLTESEWIEYLSSRYPVRFEEISHYRMWYRHSG